MPDVKGDRTPVIALTSEAILARLPEFDETSYGNDSVVDLAGTSRWLTLTRQTGPERGHGGGSGVGRDFKSVQAYRDAYGKRGEQWVAEQEKRALVAAGRPDLAELVVHRSQIHEGSPWDIESFKEILPAQEDLRGGQVYF